jgi:hypothetical protein
MSDQKLASAYNDAMETIVKLEDEIERLRWELEASQAALSENLEIRAALERVTGR